MVRPPARPSVGRWAELSLEALDENAHRVRPIRPIADLRADAYGHGLALVADRLDAHGFDAFLVSPGVSAPGLRTHLIVDAAAAPTDAAILTGPELYGAVAGWRAVLRVGAEILAVKEVAADEGVSYGYTYVTPGDTTLALVGAGYAHGIVRRASNAARVAVGGEQRTIVGMISMDQCSVDLAGADASAGDDVVFYGDPARGEPSLAQWQEDTGIRALAITARLSPQVERRIA